jgi:hypothetical protein
VGSSSASASASCSVDFFAWLLIGIGAGFILMGFIAALARR